MLEVIIIAFTMGVIGSFHCMGMCGPLALSLPINSDSTFSKFSGAFIYNAGRIITYSILGLIFGLIGRSFALLGFQQWLSILLGTLILLLFGLPKLFPAAFKKINPDWAFVESVRMKIGKLFKEKTQSSLFSIGLLNGLLPCGLVYMAVASAIATGDISKGSLFMIFFGLGTLPVMWSIAFFGNYVGVTFRSKIRMAYPFMIVLIGSLLILRGMGLGIPYLSPGADSEHNVYKCYVPK
jgi:uncharacterized protein